MLYVIVVHNSSSSYKIMSCVLSSVASSFRSGTSLSPDSEPSYDPILNLADVADASLRILFRTVLPVMQLDLYI